MVDSMQRQERAKLDERSVWHLIIIVVVAAFIALIPANRAPEPVPLTPQPSPYGYTISLALFALPLLRLGWWLYQRSDLRNQRKAWMISCSVILPAWCLLDILMGRSFFTFDNPGAHLNWLVPGYRWPWDWAREIPIEEFAFYVTGIAAILLTYIWTSEVWMSRYTHSDEERVELFDEGRLLHVNWSAVWVGMGLFGVALLWKYFGIHEAREGFPGYFAFLLATAIIPISMFVNVVRPFVNWQAFTFTMVSLMLVSLLWEVTLGVPYQYWGFQEDMMMGVFIHAWSDLPVEEPLLWIAAAWLNTISYEVIRLLLATGRPVRDLFRLGGEGVDKEVVL